MATRAKSVCRHPGCGRLIETSGHCVKHVALYRKQSDDRRGNANDRGYTRRWQKARETYLSSHPLCECDDCKAQGLVIPSIIVDHKIPHRLKEALDSGDAAAIARAQDLFWDRDNWQAMSKRCHDRKTAREDGGFGRLGGGAKKSVGFF
jgi:5-methylcytosine-specific restriction enzyme A